MCRAQESLPMYRLSAEARAGTHFLLQVAALRRAAAAGDGSASECMQWLV